MLLLDAVWRRRRDGSRARDQTGAYLWAKFYSPAPGRSEGSVSVAGVPSSTLQVNESYKWFWNHDVKVEKRHSMALKPVSWNIWNDTADTTSSHAVSLVGTLLRPWQSSLAKPDEIPRASFLPHSLSSEIQDWLKGPAPSGDNGAVFRWWCGFPAFGNSKLPEEWPLFLLKLLFWNYNVSELMKTHDCTFFLSCSYQWLLVIFATLTSIVQMPAWDCKK